MHTLVARHTAVGSLVVSTVHDVLIADSGILVGIGTSIEGDTDGNHIRLLGGITEIELHQSATSHRRIDDTQLIVAGRHMRQFNSKVIDIPSLELVGVVGTPGAHDAEAQQGTGIVADDIVEIVVLEGDTVTVTATVQGAHLRRCGEAQAVVDQLIEEG